MTVTVMAENVAISASILALLSLISTTLGVCIFLVFWKYRSNEKKKTTWKSSPSEMRTGWLQSDRKPLVPGKFSAKIVQPNLKQENDDERDTEWKESIDNKSENGQEDQSSYGEIVFILRYLVDREELMVRLVQMEGFSAGEDIYNADSAYVDVQLKHIGNVNDKESDNPPKLDIALQQVYYFIMSQDQLFSYKLMFKVNTFDQSFRRSVSGEVQVSLFEELGKHIFTGDEVILSKKILPVSQHSSNEKDQSSEVEEIEEDKEEEQQETIQLEAVTSPTTSPLSWDSEIDVDSSLSSGLVPYEDYSDGVQWHRLSGDSWDEKGSFQWPYLSESVVSVPSSFQFNASNESAKKLQKNSIDHLRIEESMDNPLMRRSISESYIPHYGRLSPPPKNFYHLMPIPLSTKLHNSPFTPLRHRHTAGHRLRGKEPMFTFDQHEKLGRKRSLSLPSLIRNLHSTPARNFNGSIKERGITSEEQ